MKNILKISALAAMLVFGACNKMVDEVPELRPVDESTNLILSGSDISTKTSIDENLNVLWTSNDKVGLFCAEASLEKTQADGKGSSDVANIPYILKSGENQSLATFKMDQATMKTEAENLINGTGVRPSATGNIKWGDVSKKHTFYSYYPYQRAARSATFSTAIPVSIPDKQIQIGNNNNHIQNYDFTYAKAEITAPEGVKEGDYITGEINFQYKHIYTLLEFDITNSGSEDLSIEKISLRGTAMDFMADNAPDFLVGDFIFDLSTEKIIEKKTINPNSGAAMDSYANHAAELLVYDETGANFKVLKTGESTKAYMIIKPFDFATMPPAELSIFTDKGILKISGINKYFEAGKKYTKSVSIDAANLTAKPELHIVDFEDDMMAMFLAGPTSYGDNLYTTFSDDQTVDGITYTNYFNAYTNYGGIPDQNGYISLVPNTDQMWSGGTYVSRWNYKDKGDYTNQCSVYYGDHGMGNGGNNNSATFGLAYASLGGMGGGEGGARIDYILDEEGATFDHMYVNNSTYNVVCIRDGNQFSTPAGPGFTFSLVIKGVDKDGNITGAVEHYLADYRTPSSKGCQEVWEKVDLRSLGKVTKLYFSCNGTDSGSYGLNTPAYFCFDDIAIQMK